MKTLTKPKFEIGKNVFLLSHEYGPYNAFYVKIIGLSIDNENEWAYRTSHSNVTPKDKANFLFKTKEELESYVIESLEKEKDHILDQINKDLTRDLEEK